MKSFKRDFPIFKNQKLVYLDSAATSQKPQIVLDAMQDYYKQYNSNVRRGLYPIAERATAKVEEVRAKVAKFINADKEEIIFVRNATEALNLVAYSMSKDLSSKDTIASTIMEHHSNFVPWQQLAHQNKIKFEVLDFTAKVIQQPKLFGFDNVVPSFISAKILIWLLSPFIKYTSPTFFWLLVKKD